MASVSRSPSPARCAGCSPSASTQPWAASCSPRSSRAGSAPWGTWWLNAAGIALSIAAIAAPITGLVALVGRAGIAAGPVIFMLVGNPREHAAKIPEAGDPYPL